MRTATNQRIYNSALIPQHSVLVVALCALLFALCSSATAQQPKKVPRIGYLSNGDSTSESTRSDAIRLALRELGYIEGQNIAIEYRYAERKRDQLSALADELVRLKVDIVMVAGGPAPIRAAMKATKTIPILMVGTPDDPVEAGLVKSLARPGGNVTGLTNVTRELGGKRLELLKGAVPKVARVAVFYDPTVPASVLDVKQVLPLAASGLGLTLQPKEVRATDNFEKVFAALNKQRPDGLYVTTGPLMFANQKRIAGFVGEPVTVDARQKRSCRCRWAHVVRRGHRRQLPARRQLRGQDTEGSKTGRSADRATDEVRAGD